LEYYIQIILIIPNRFLYYKIKILLYQKYIDQEEDDEEKNTLKRKTIKKNKATNIKAEKAYSQKGYNHIKNRQKAECKKRLEIRRNRMFKKRSEK
jgi:hypothetical protein